MSKKKQQSYRTRMASAVATGFALVVLAIPVLFTGRWVYTLAVNSHDPRHTMNVPAFQARSADDTSMPLVPFKEPVISITFDDGWETAYTQGLPVMQRDGVHSTQYIITDTFDNHSYMSVAQIKSMQKSGTEIAAHTITHPDLTTLDDAQLNNELAVSQATLRKDFGGSILDFTSPYGAYNAHTLSVISKYYRSQKNAEGDPAANALEAINIGTTFNPLNFKSYSIRNTTKLSDLQKLITAAEQNNAWLVLTYHQIDNSNETYSVTPAVFKQQMSLVTDTSVRFATVGQMMDALHVTQQTKTPQQVGL